MLCTHCGRPVVLVPSAAERAAKYGGTPAYYTRLFPTHANCLLEQRRLATSLLIASRYTARSA